MRLVRSWLVSFLLPMLGCHSFLITTCRFSILSPRCTEARCHSGLLSTSYSCWVYIYLLLKPSLFHWLYWMNRCIGGVGAFLIETGFDHLFLNVFCIFIWFSSRFSLTVSLRISDDDFNMTWETFQFTFLDAHNLLLWTLPLFLAILLRFITHKFHHQLIFPLCVWFFRLRYQH